MHDKHGVKIEVGQWVKKPSGVKGMVVGFGKIAPACYYQPGKEFDQEYVWYFRKDFHKLSPNQVCGGNPPEVYEVLLDEP